MKRLDFYFSVSLISFIICLGFSNREVINISGYFYFLEQDSNLFISLSGLFALLTIFYLFRIIINEINRYITKN